MGILKSTDMLPAFSRSLCTLIKTRHAVERIIRGWSLGRLVFQANVQTSQKISLRHNHCSAAVARNASIKSTEQTRAWQVQNKMMKKFKNPIKNEAVKIELGKIRTTKPAPEQ